MPSIELNSQTPFVLTVSGSVNSAGEVIADLTPADILDAGGALLASNNLSDVASAVTARTNLAVNKPALTCNVAVAATTASAVYLRVPSDYSGTVSSIVGVTNGDPGGNVAFTSAIGTSGGAYNAITSGGFTVANGATAGTASVATPSAANTVVGGTSIIRVSWDNGAAAAVGVGLTIEITRT